MKKISRIEPVRPVLTDRKKVAAYARVSRDTERLMNSVSAQVSYYSALIQNNPEWEYAGVYADCGISGTGTARRSEFLRMLADCEAGRINIILTKSISRFARNTVDLLETVAPGVLCTGGEPEHLGKREVGSQAAVPVRRDRDGEQAHPRIPV